jgi:hypothetical protein
VSATEYIASFFLVIVGFTISELLKGSARIVRERRRIKFYWPYLVVLPFAYEMMIFWFLHLFEVVTGHVGAWSTRDLAIISLQVIPWAFISYLIFPSRINEGFDMKAFYFDTAKVMIVIVTMLNILVAVDMYFMDDKIGFWMQITSITINLIVLRYFEKLHLVWLTLTFVLANYFIFFVKPITIGG